jgi:hypothetical protein
MKKTMLITSYDIKGIAYFEFIPLGRTVNHAYYAEILKRLGQAVSIKWKGLNFGQTIGYSTMTMIQLTSHYLSSSF